MLSVIFPDHVLSAAINGAAAMQPETNRTNARRFIPTLYSKNIEEIPGRFGRCCYHSLRENRDSRTWLYGSRSYRRIFKIAGRRNSGRVIWQRSGALGRLESN